MKKENLDVFNDRNLINLARYNFQFLKTEIRPDNIEKLLHKEKLSNSERNSLVEFISNSKYSKPMSMSQMKRRVLEEIGYVKSINNYQNTVNREELEAIYNFIVKLKK